MYFNFGQGLRLRFRVFRILVIPCRIPIREIEYESIIRHQNGQFHQPNVTILLKQLSQNGGNKIKSVRKHRGIYQSGPKAGKLRPGFKYTGKRTKTGLKVIAEIKK